MSERNYNPPDDAHDIHVPPERRSGEVHVTVPPERTPEPCRLCGRPHNGKCKPYTFDGQPLCDHYRNPLYCSRCRMAADRKARAEGIGVDLWGKVDWRAQSEKAEATLSASEQKCAELVAKLRQWEEVIQPAHVQARAELAAALDDAENVLDGIEQGRGQCGEFFCADLAMQQRARRTDCTVILASYRAQVERETLKRVKRFRVEVGGLSTEEADAWLAEVVACEFSPKGETDVAL